MKKKNSPKKPAKESANEEAMLALIRKVLAENRKDHIARKRSAYEAKLWRNYKALSSNLIRFYKRQEARNAEVEYVDGSNLTEKMFEEGSVLQLISEINDKLKKDDKK